jgi:hypothetical protein
MYLIYNCVDDKMISLPDLGRPRDAMMPRAPDTEALYEGSAQKGFGVLSIDGSPVPLGLTALLRSLLGHIAREVEWGEPPMTTGLKTLWIERQSNPKQKNTSDTQQPSGGQAVSPYIRCRLYFKILILTRSHK